MVSIIIPTYNRGEQIVVCLDSIFSANYKDIEVIIVDDGSTDNTGEICRRYAVQDSRVKYVYQENGGVSKARNRGLSLAKGEWITFVDSDDAVLPHHFDLVFKYGNDEKCSLLMTGSSFGKVEDGKPVALNTHESEIVERGDAVDYLFGEFDPYKQGFFFIWNKLFRHEIISEHNIRFNETMSLDEDQEFVCQYLKYARGIAYDKSPSYLTLEWPGITHLGSKLRTPEDYFYNQCTGYDTLIGLFNVTQNHLVRKYAATYAVERTVTRILMPYTQLGKWGGVYNFTIKQIMPFMKGINLNSGYVLSGRCKSILRMLRAGFPRTTVLYCRMINILRFVKHRIA